MIKTVLELIKKHKLLILILMISFTIRLIFSLGNDKSLFCDINSYDSFGYQLAAHGNLWGSAYHAPGYVFFLALIYLVSGHSFLNVYIVQCFMGAATTLLVYLIAKNISNQRVGIISAFLSLFYWPFNLYSGILLAEVLFLFLLLSGVLAFFKALDSGSKWAFIISSICFALSTLTRSVNLPFLVIIPLIYIWLRREHLKSALGNALVYILVFCAVLAPWTIRNYVVSKAFIPVDNLSGLNLYIGNNPKAEGYFVDISGDPVFDPSLSNLEIDRKLKEAGVQYIKENPVRFAKLTVKRAFLFVVYDFKELDWVNFVYLADHPLLKGNSYFLPIIGLMLLSNIIVFWIGAAGVFRLAKSNKGLVLVLFILFYWSTISVFYIQARYRLPIVPFLLVGGGMFLDWVVNGSQKIIERNKVESTLPILPEAESQISNLSP